MNELTERTKISLWLAVLAVGGATTWVTSISLSAAESANKIASLEKKQEQYLESISSIKSDLAVIKERVESVNNKLGGSHGR